MVHEIVGRINGHYGTLTHVPIHHLDRQLSFHELCALYAITDVALVTSLRDGMNLVSYEYVACQSDNAGQLHLIILGFKDFQFSTLHLGLRNSSSQPYTSGCRRNCSSLHSLQSNLCL